MFGFGFSADSGMLFFAFSSRCTRAVYVHSELWVGVESSLVHKNYWFIASNINFPAEFSFGSLIHCVSVAHSNSTHSTRLLIETLFFCLVSSSLYYWNWVLKTHISRGRGVSESRWKLLPDFLKKKNRMRAQPFLPLVHNVGRRMPTTTSSEPASHWQEDKQWIVCALLLAVVDAVRRVDSDDWVEKLCFFTLHQFRDRLQQCAVQRHFPSIWPKHAINLETMLLSK